MKRNALLIALVGCTSIEYPSPTPPPPWGAPISGGTMLVTRDGTRAIVADPDRDRVVFVDLDTGKSILDVKLEAGSDPGRIVEDGAGRVHIALRGTANLFTFDAATGEPIMSRATCREPRGLAWDSATDQLHVACTTGELVSFAADGDVVRAVFVDRDLRDVVVRGSQLAVTRFRSAEILTLDAQGAIVTRASVRNVQRIEKGGPFGGEGSGEMVTEASPTVAWRAIALPDGRMAISHQRKAGQMLRITTGGYESGCNQGIVESAITIVDAAGTPTAVAPFVQGSLPVDVAVDDQGSRLAFVSAGRKTVHVVPMSALSQPDDDQCGDTDQRIVRLIDDQLGAPTSVAFRKNGELVVFYPEYPALVVHAALDVADSSVAPRTIALPGEVGYDSGRALFHTQTQAGITCASCHPEAREDGQTWSFDPIGDRRTQSVAGGILSRGPYHWSADMADLTQLMTDVFGNRMFGGALTKSQLASLGPWLDRVPAPQTALTFVAATDPDAVTRGQQLFMSQEAGCATCHAGPLFTNNSVVNVGTGANFKVPSLLGVAVRAPYMHDGCAATLRDRFGTCGGGDLHGKTSTLTESQLADLIAFLDSL
ncbi:MAG TPA: hypothetical protein VIV11_20240 [Kofleriaceae bacterium]